MILCFPDLDTLRLALTGSAALAKAGETPAAAGFDDRGRVWLQPSTDLPRAALNDLRQLGVQAARASPVPLTEPVTCWLQLFPLQREGSLAVTDRAPVLFDLPAEQLTDLVSEMLRLGNDRQSFRYLRDARQPSAAGRVLLRVIGPPYYSLLRALDGDSQADAPVAYVECAPGVWVQLGYRHPLGPQLKPRPGQVLLMRPPRQWTFIEEGPFRDIYEVIEFQLPYAPVNYREAALGRRLVIPLRLAQGGGADAAELWVLRDRPHEQLDALVHHADDQLLARLDFAVGDRDGQPVIVLRVRPSKQPPPVLVLQATAFRSYLRLPNLFLPCSMALQPPLRRDVVRKLLADDPAVITWLYPHGDGRFTPETVPDSAFRPLSDWIDYVLEHDRQALELWVQSTQFDFESFICADDQPARPPKPPADHRRAADRDKPPVVEPAREQPQKEVPTVLSAKPHRPEEDLEDDFFEAPRGEPSVQEKQRQLRELEERFKSLEGPLDSKERRALWPELAIRNADVGNTDEAGLCWMNALWLTERAPARWLWAWFRTEARAVPARVEKGESRPRSWAEVPPLPPGKAIDLSGADLDRLLALPDPSTADLRTLSAYLTWAAHRSPPPAPVVQRLNRLRLLLEKHEDLLPVRAAWLAWVSLARLSGGDVLILARARDRLLERLFRSGLEPRLDLPSFLRFAGQPTGPRFHAMRDWLPRLRELAQRWLRRQPPPVIYSDYREPRTAQYIDLMFAFALAKVGDVEASRRLLDQAKAVLGEDGHQAHEFLLEAFAYRIHQAQEGKPPGGPLPAEQMEYLALLAKQYEEVKEKNSYSPHYIIDRMRWLSRILEPDQRVDPYREIKGRASDLDRALARLPDILDRAELAERITRLLDRPPQGTDPRQARARILKVGLEQAARVGEEFAVALLDRTLPAFDALPPPRDAYQFEQHATLLEKGIFLAAHFDQPTYVQQLVARFERLLEAQGVDVIQSLDSLAAQCFRGLRKLGMRDVIDRLLRKMAERILEGQELKSLTVEWAASHPEALQALLHVAGGWFYFERDGQAEFILRVARKLLFDNKLEVKRKTRLACVYASTLGQAKVAVAQRGLEELFQKLEGIRDGFGTNKYYGWHQLQIVEAVVLAVVSDDFMMGADARRWLDDDEFLVRRRIHHDLRTMMAHSG